MTTVFAFQLRIILKSDLISYDTALIRTDQNVLILCDMTAVVGFKVEVWSVLNSFTLFLAGLHGCIRRFSLSVREFEH
ncbi:hypothetical protein BH23BAC3_BH23BAC3_06790 [soil metagenome]